MLGGKDDEVSGKTSFMELDLRDEGAVAVSSSTGGVIRAEEDS